MLSNADSNIQIKPAAIDISVEKINE